MKKYDKVTGLTASKLIDFEKQINALYQEGKIEFPIHLAGGNEKPLIDIFKKIKPSDWIFSTYRSHYHWLLSGRSPEELKQKILEGKSMHLYDKRFFTSSIVGGVAPIALGVALVLKREKSSCKVWCFMGDMAFSSGLVCECIRYTELNDLPIIFVNEDNGYSVNTPTEQAWGGKVKHYTYKRTYPHAANITAKICEDSEYYKAVCQAMERLGRLPNSIFLGQHTRFGNCAGTLKGVPDDKKIELPVAEEMQMGMSIGLALEGFLPISVYQRMDFLPRAFDQIVNHLCLIKELSGGIYNPKVIIRTAIGKPNSGLQHNKDLISLFLQLGLRVLNPKHSTSVKESYDLAESLDQSVMIVEYHQLYES